jgi:toxin CptA
VSSIAHSALLRTRQAILEVQAGEGRSVVCFTRTGEWHEAEILDSSFVAPWLTVLNLKQLQSGLIRHVLIVPDNVDPEAFRHLRVWLRWGLPARATSPDRASSNLG